MNRAKKFAILAFVGGLAASGNQGVYAGQKFSSPRYHNYNLDWCLTFEHECGKPAADAFCHMEGQGQAASFEKWNNPGFRTMTIGQNSVCDPSSHVCDSFSVIECQGNGQTFKFPEYRGYRLDWCRVFENECGGPAANAFCVAQGFGGQSGFQKQPSPGVATMTIGQNSVCDPSSHVCDSFSSISCQ
jgi:hypothetical protein